MRYEDDDGNWFNCDFMNRGEELGLLGSMFRFNFTIHVGDARCKTAGYAITEKMLGGYVNTLRV